LLHSFNGNFNSAVCAGNARDVSPSKIFVGEKLIRFGQIWLDLGKIKAKIGAKLG